MYIYIEYYTMVIVVVCAVYTLTNEHKLSRTQSDSSEQDIIIIIIIIPRCVIDFI